MSLVRPGAGTISRLILLGAFIVAASMLSRAVFVDHSLNAVGGRLALASLTPPAGFSGVDGCDDPTRACFVSGAPLRPQSPAAAAALIARFGVSKPDIACETAGPAFTCHGTGNFQAVPVKLALTARSYGTGLTVTVG
jgi:hypothetical protein